MIQTSLKRERKKSDGRKFARENWMKNLTLYRVIVGFNSDFTLHLDISDNKEVEAGVEVEKRKKESNQNES